jgi:hypothetical protein
MAVDTSWCLVSYQHLLQRVVRRSAASGRSAARSEDDHCRTRRQQRRETVAMMRRERRDRRDGATLKKKKSRRKDATLKKTSVDHIRHYRETRGMECLEKTCRTQRQERNEPIPMKRLEFRLEEGQQQSMDRGWNTNRIDCGNRSDRSSHSDVFAIQWT